MSRRNGFIGMLQAALCAAVAHAQPPNPRSTVRRSIATSVRSQSCDSPTYAPEVRVGPEGCWVFPNGGRIAVLAPPAATR